MRAPAARVFGGGVADALPEPAHARVSAKDRPGAPGVNLRRGALVFWLAQVGRHGEAAAMGTSHLVEVEAVARPFDVELRTIGTVQPYSTVAVKSRVDGQVMVAHFQDGQFVKKGDRLFTIDTRNFEAQLRQVTANLARDRAQLTRAKEELDRQTDLMRKEYSSRQKFDEAKANAIALEATVKAGEAAVEMARLQLEYSSIYSPP